MAKKKRGKPRRIVIPGDFALRLIVLRVEDTHEDGTPRRLYWLRDNETTDLETQSNRFILAYVDEVNIGNGGSG
ncbi:MAG: hypothetical protein AB7U73_01310 [Pirellulales bacterium]